MILRLLFVVAFWALAPLASAQELASLIADEIEVDLSGRVTATGNVEVFYKGTRLTASSISYFRDEGRLTIEGPIRVFEADGTILVASSAELDRDLRTGILRSARLVLDQQLQLAANEISRVGDRYTNLDRVVASSCEICASNPTPVWEIRARQVIHDREERQLYFSDAQLRIVGIPVFYAPRLRLPDPTLKRARGFLPFRLNTSSDLGTGVRMPYFIPFGPHQDITVTPYLATSTQTVELAFRKEMRLGSIRAEGAATKDDIEGSRGYLFADAQLLLPRGFRLDGQVEFVSDPGYLFTYNYSDKDRLTNEVAITRYRDKDRFHAAVTEFRTLRPSEIPIRDTLPDRFVELTYSRDIPALSFGGKTTATVRAAALNRPSSLDVNGRDTSRIGVALDWRDDWLFGPGLVASAELGVNADAYNIGQDSNFASNVSRIVPRGAFELRWPFARQTQDGGREILEPIVRFDLADERGESVPVEDSVIVEFDEANLFSHSRYPGVDGAEEGGRVAVGIAWRRSDPSGWTLNGALGRVAHLDGDLGFAEGSGLVGDESEWLLAARFGMGDRVAILNRSLFDESLDFTLSETRVDWRTDTFSLGSSYVFAVPEPAEGRTDKLSEWSFEGDYALNDRWTASAEWRYDFTGGRAARTGVGLGYRSECIDVSFTLSRRFADSTAVDPTTDFGFRVELIGAGGDTGQRSERSSCRG